MDYGDFKYLTRRTASDKIVCDKALNITKNPKYDGYQRGADSIFFDKKTSATRARSDTLAGSCIKNENI